MKYNFSNVLQDKSDPILDTLMSKYVNSTESYNYSKVKDIYGKIVFLLNTDFTSKEILELYKELATYKISIDIPYIIMTNEIYGLKNILLSNVANNTDSNVILNLISLFKEINNSVAYMYLTNYINNLLLANDIRLDSISDAFSKDDVIQYYEAHLHWLSNLVLHIKNSDKFNFPEVDYIKCTFGTWLNNDAKKIIHDDSKFELINTLHKNLHIFAKKIFLNLKTSDYHILISYLEKCELASLSIGTELALIDNIQINKNICKDNLTGALNRNSLSTIFKTQYELFYATTNSFILAMCDLDYFKKVNDTYGHVAGDKMLRLFVDTIKEHTRNSDIIIRYGGEEFIIILPAIQRDYGLKILNTIREAFEKKVLTFEDKEITATVSIGCMWITPDTSYKNKYLEKYIMLVDKMLYVAKENGRNRVEIL